MGFFSTFFLLYIPLFLNHSCHSFSGFFTPIFLVIYVSNGVEKRRILYNQLRDYVPYHDQLCNILRDFNCCRFDLEKVGGNLISIARFGELNNVLSYHSVQDLTSVGLFYTLFYRIVDRSLYIHQT